MSYTFPTQTSCLTRKSYHSSRVRVRMIVSTSSRALISSAFAARTNWSARRLYLTKSGRPMALQKFSQSQGSVQPIERSFLSLVSYTA